MDLDRRAHYVASAMELLLILSAMLSAVTGAFSGVRAPEASPHAATAAVGAQIAASAAEQQAPEARRAVPAQEGRSTEVQPLPELAVAPAAPLYADRLIE